MRNRMSVLRLSDGGFAVFSPLAATPECVGLLLDLIRKERLKLSSAYLIAPSTYPEHHESLAVRACVCVYAVYACVCAHNQKYKKAPTLHLTNHTAPTKPPKPPRRGARPSRRRAS